VETDSRLVEINFGEAEGSTFSKYTKKNGEAFCNRIFSSVADADMDIPEESTGAESKRQAQTRAMDALTDIAQHTSANTIGVACHGFMMTLIAAFASKGRFFNFNNGDLLHISYENDEWQYIDIVRNMPDKELKY
jgi:broad specificity phosphatase PhoE